MFKEINKQRNNIIHKKSEREIEISILEYLSKIPCAFFWKNNTFVRYDATKGIFYKTKNKFAINGVSDIIGVYKGRPVFIEVKVPERKNNLSEGQKNFIKNINAVGGFAFVATNLADVVEKLKIVG